MENAIHSKTQTALSRALQPSTKKMHNQILNAANSANISPEQMQKIDRLAQDFEAIFLSEMMKPMFSGIKTDGQFGGGKGEEIFRGMMVQEYGKDFAKSGGIGIADHVKAQIIKLQSQTQ